jgi:hypothetical protein
MLYMMLMEEMSIRYLVYCCNDIIYELNLDGDTLLVFMYGHFTQLLLHVAIVSKV